MDSFAAARDEMIRTQIEARGITDRLVLDAMRMVPRHLFVPPELVSKAYDDGPQAIGHGQTISQPFIVALMTYLVEPAAGLRVLEIGSGCGYQTAVLAAAGCCVFGMDIVPELVEAARARLSIMEFPCVPVVRAGDGTRGWPEEAPFDACLVAAAPAEPPPALLEQLVVGGRLVIPYGPSSGTQMLCVFTRTASGFDRREVAPVRFVPMTGLAATG
jgi:protein-L-isoaspartate(D-aspartate) O-methyltransferase